MQANVGARRIDLISDALPLGRLWYDGAGAVGNAIGYPHSKLGYKKKQKNL